MRRVEPDRREDRQYLIVEIAPAPGFELRRPVGPEHEVDACRLQRRQDGAVEQLVLARNHVADPLLHRADHLADRQTVGLAMAGVGERLFDEAGKADLEEFVEVGADDADKAQALEQWHAFIRRLRQHPLVERQNAEFPVQQRQRRGFPALGHVWHRATMGAEYDTPMTWCNDLGRPHEYFFCMS